MILPASSSIHILPIDGTAEESAILIPSIRDTNTHLVLSELAHDWLVQQKADVLHQIEGPGRRGALVDLLLVFGLMGVDALQDAQAPGNNKQYNTDHRAVNSHGLKCDAKDIMTDTLVQSSPRLTLLPTAPPPPSYEPIVCVLYVLALKKYTWHCVASYPSYLCCAQGMSYPSDC